MTGANEMKKTPIFISVIDEEKTVALSLKKLLETIFIEVVDVFVAFDPISLPPGKKWLEEISIALQRCEVEFVIASPLSVKKPWINFEAGAGWIRKIPVIPLCHSGMEKGKLPRPLCDLQAALLTDETDMRSVLPVVADKIGSAVPKCDFSEFFKIINEFEAVSKALDSFADQLPIAATDGLAPHEFATLVKIGEDADPNSGIVLHQLKHSLEQTGLTHLATKLAVKKLERLNLIEMKEEQENYQTFTVIYVTDDGWHWLERNKDRLALTVAPPPTTTPPEPPVKAIFDDDVPF